jgi:hypothetical protein
MKKLFALLIIISSIACAREEFQAYNNYCKLVKIDKRQNRDGDFRYIYHWETVDQGIKYWTIEKQALYTVGMKVPLHTKF